ncbi:MAG: putative metal-binding motif-containing protein [Myxococcaceae bacterium]|nr:putative metal-binding motif-containing protein [Myxococcaceae bacterium]
MTRAHLTRLVAATALLGGACLEPWKPTGPYACASDGTCAEGLVCDDGVCCQPGGTPACPTLPVEGVCPSGAPRRFYRDLDGDGSGAGQPRLFCALPQREAWAPESLDGGRVTLDCNDDPDGGVPVNPRAPERCNGLDDDCDGVIDEGLMPQSAWYRDLDGDGFGSDGPGDVTMACGQPAGTAPRAGDCDTMNPDVFPGARERCNNVDDNCNGVTDEPPLADAETPGVTGSPTVGCDGGVGVCRLGGLECRRNAGTQLNELVCVPRTRPSFERCDDLDNDCNGLVDDPPGCGGPTSFLNTPRVQVGAFRTPIASTMQPSLLPQRCLTGLPSNDAQSWFNPAWVGAQAETSTMVPLRHTWFAEAEPGSEWDLSRRTALELVLRDRTELGSNLFNTSHFPGPVVTLCGPLNQHYLRLSPTMNQLAQQGTFRAALPFAGMTGWSREQSPGFDLSRVTRVEVTVGPVPVVGGGLFDVKTLTIVVSPDAGFLR